VATVGSDHDSRNGVLVAFHSRAMNPNRIRYLLRSEWTDTEPGWYIAHATATEAPPPPVLRLADGRTFRAIRRFGYSGLSGWSWHVYRRQPDSP
jgi:hypothetical protein